MATRERHPLLIPYDCLAGTHPGRQAVSILTGKGGSHSRSDGRSATWAARAAAAGGVDGVSAAGNGAPARDGAASGDVRAPRDVRAGGDVHIGGDVCAAGGHPARRARLGVAVPAVWATPDLRAPPRDPRRRAVSAGPGLPARAWVSSAA